MQERPTINDIARLAGVSKATVSRVLNRKPDVDSATRERVLRIVEEHGYMPSITASGLAGGRSKLIGVLVASFTWPLAPTMLQAVAECIYQTPYELVLYSIHNTIVSDKERAKAIDRILATKLTSGLLAIFPGVSTHRHLTKLYKQGFPVVMIDDQVASPSLPLVTAEDFKGAYEAVRYLIGLGHRSIALIQGPPKQFCTEERTRGYSQALLDAGLSVHPHLILQGDHSTASGHDRACQLFSLPPEERPTAIFASNDQMAYGVMTAADQFGIRVPEDVSLVGFDDIDLSAHLRPPLTTVKQPFYEMGQRAIELLLSLVNSSQAFVNAGDERDGALISARQYSEELPIHIQLPTSLIIRESCKPFNPLSVSVVGND